MKKEDRRKILLINTLKEEISVRVLEEKLEAMGNAYETVHTKDMNIRNCIGCNHCWLKTPGICTIKDDYEVILRKILQADQMWLIAETKFGFVSYQAKNIIDRIMPLVTMYLHIKKGEMRHVMRYKKRTDFGVIYRGDGDKEYLKRWAERTALNLESHSLGAYDIEEEVAIRHAFSDYKR